MTRDELLALITSHYLHPNEEFNGFRVASTNANPDELRVLLRELIEEDLVSIHLGPHPNPYVKGLPALPRDVQLEALEQLEDLTHLTAYPERKHLESVVDREAYERRPFTLRLALGEAQLSAAFFDLSVLEVYRNDPRYLYETNDQAGFVSVTDSFYETGAMRDSDQVLIESFGFGYDQNFQRAVCVFMRYLSRLTPEHQEIWRARELEGDYRMHPAYFKSSVMGDFPDKEPLFVAFVEELDQIQRMCEAVGLPPLVRKSFKEATPTNFSFLIRPTLKELQDFHSILDKLMSENLNKKFFAEFIPQLENEQERADGKVIVTPKGTIALLEEWVGQFKYEDRAGVDDMVATFREVRKLRQRPAHTADDNTFDPKYFQDERDLMVRAYRAVRTLRELMALHPDLRDYDGVPDWLEKGEICTY